MTQPRGAYLGTRVTAPFHTANWAPMPCRWSSPSIPSCQLLHGCTGSRRCARFSHTEYGRWYLQKQVSVYNSIHLCTQLFPQGTRESSVPFWTLVVINRHTCLNTVVMFDYSSSKTTYMYLPLLSAASGLQLQIGLKWVDLVVYHLRCCPNFLAYYCSWPASKQATLSRLQSDSILSVLG